jgi:hypothetical protein
MQMHQRQQNFRYLNLATILVAVLAVLFIGTGASIFHIDPPGSAATCPFCCLAHISALPGVAIELPLVIAAIEAIAPSEVPFTYAAPTSLILHSRAPPA